MTFSLWLAFATASAILVVIPGPTVLLVLSYALGQGRRVALASVAGVALGDLVAMTASSVGLGALVLASAALFAALKWIGAVYLLYLGVRMLRSAPGPAQMQGAPETSSRHVFAHAALVTALNPKSIAFFIAFVPQFLSPDAALLPQFAVVIPTFVALGALNALAYALMADRLRRNIAGPRLIQWLTRAGGAALIVMGLVTATMRRGVA